MFSSVISSFCIKLNCEMFASCARATLPTKLIFYHTGLFSKILTKIYTSDVNCFPITIMFS